MAGPVWNDSNLFATTPIASEEKKLNSSVHFSLAKLNESVHIFPHEPNGSEIGE
jgi:hypothetical protein